MNTSIASRQLLRQQSKRILFATGGASSQLNEPSRRSQSFCHHRRQQRFAPEFATPQTTSTFNIHRFFSAGSDPEYESRERQYGLASKEEVAKSALSPDTVWLDVRSPAEIEEETFTAREHIYCWCTMDDTSRLREQADELFPDKDGRLRRCWSVY